MKTPSENLHRLVHSMTAAEKRYFKRHYSSGKNMLTELFNFINSLSTYDEDLVKQHFTGSKLVKNLKVYKVQLTDLLLKSLASYNYKSNVRSRIRFGIEEAHILLDKQLYAMARGKIKKLKQLCQDNEEYDYLMSVLKLEGQFYTFYNITPDANIANLFEEIEAVKDHINTLVYLQKISSQLIKFTNSGKTFEEFENFDAILQKVNSIEPQGLVEAHYRFQTLASLYALKGDRPKELHYKKAGVNLFTEHEDKIPAKVSMYFSAIHNYLSSCNTHRQFDDFEEQFRLIKSLIEQHPNLDRNFIFILYLKIRSLFRQGKFTEISWLLENKILETAKRYEMESPLILSSIYLHLAVTYLYRENFQKALHYLREVEVNHLHNPPPIQQISYLIEIICHYETEAKSVMENLVFSLKRRSKKKQHYTPFFKEMLSFFPKTMRLDPGEQVPKFLELKHQLDEFKTDPCLIAFNGLGLEYWLLAKVQDKPISTLLKEQKLSNINAG